MNVQGLIDKAEHNQAPQSVTGQWSNIQLALDEFSREYLNIGVAFQAVDGELYTRFLCEFDAFKCLYGKTFDTSELSFLITNTERSLRSQRTTSLEGLSLISPQVRLTPVGSFSGNSVRDIMDFLFHDTLTLARRKPERKKREFQSKTTDEVRATVFEILKKSIGLDADKLILPNGLETYDSNTRRHIDIALQTQNKVGTIASACYQTWETVEANVLRAEFSLNAAAENGRYQRGLFICRPFDTTGIKPQQITAIDNGIDNYIWMMQKAGIKLDVHDNEAAIAEQIMEWACV